MKPAKPRQASKARTSVLGVPLPASPLTCPNSPTARTPWRTVTQLWVPAHETSNGGKLTPWQSPTM